MISITKIRIVLTEKNERLKGFVSVVLNDAFCINDLKIIKGNKGIFIAMPTRKIMDYCKCGHKNILLAEYCNRCGIKLGQNRGVPSENGTVKYFSDIIHPITTEFRKFLNDAILAEYELQTRNL